MDAGRKWSQACCERGGRWLISTKTTCCCGRSARASCCAAGELVNEAELDWPNIAEEIESVGPEQLHLVQSLLMQSLVHMLKARAWPWSRDAPSWNTDAIRFRTDATRRFVPSMRQRIDVTRLYRQALRALPKAIDGQPPLPIQTEMPTLDELLSDDDRSTAAPRIRRCAAALKRAQCRYADAEALGHIMTAT